MSLRGSSRPARGEGGFLSIMGREAGKEGVLQGEQCHGVGSHLEEGVSTEG